MKLPFVALLAAAQLGALTLCAATPAQEKAFLEKYQKAFEAGDTKSLQSFLYSQGANPMALQFYIMLQADGAGGKILKIELVDLTSDDLKKATAIMPGPGGLKMRLPLKPVKKLKISILKRSGESTSTSNTENYVAEIGDKLVIPVPVTAK